MTCVECGAEMGTSTLCQRCGAPVVVRAPATPSARAAGRPARKRLGTWIWGVVVALVNVVALYLAIGFPVIYATQGTPAQQGQDYIPLWAVLFMAILCGSVPVLTVFFLVRWLVRRFTARRARASDTPAHLH